ncbi:hypothetical protein PABG_06019 [Paracoccidioides brasiliensis Pb03]|nr:hypothetical protein PABG_06019 [Paracoccidioides brasiliensis Pb03]
MACLGSDMAATDVLEANSCGNSEIDQSPSPTMGKIGQGESHPWEEATDGTVEQDTSSQKKPEETDAHERPRSSSSSSHPSETFTGEENDHFDRRSEIGRTARTMSSRTSISSLPGSVIVCPPEKYDGSGTITPSFRGHYMQHYSERNTNDGPMPVNGNRPKRNNYSSRLSKIAPSVRDHDSPFRHPSSVRAMQMGDEDEYDGYGYGYNNEDLMPSRSWRNHSGGRGHSCQSVSGMSMRSLGSSPVSAKRSYKSPRAKEAAVQKEYPLILLHCTLLPPSLSLPQGLGLPSAQILKEVLPPKLWARWILLEDKIINSGVLRDRGLLISHPQEMYDMLEERLLESLELVRPRLSEGHFLGRENDDDPDDGGGGGSEKEGIGYVSDGCDGEKCADCGARLMKHLEGEKRRWDVRVYAANGLMGAGAWAAAWRDMEKVDVEVGLALPVEIRRELERRIVEENTLRMEEEQRLVEEEKRRREIYGVPTAPTQEAIDGLEDGDSVPRFQSKFDQSSPPLLFTRPEPPPIMPSTDFYERERESIYTKEVNLQILFSNYIRILASDRRNVAIAFLSILVLYFSMGMAKQGEIFASHAITSPPHVVPPTVSSPMVLEHNLPSIVNSPVMVSMEPRTQIHSGAENKINPTISGCGVLATEPRSVGQTMARQLGASHPAESDSIYHCQDLSTKASTQPQPQPSPAKSTDVAESSYCATETQLHVAPPPAEAAAHHDTPPTMSKLSAVVKDDDPALNTKTV